MARKTIRDDLYGAMRAALSTNAGYIYRGRDRQPGPQTGRGTLLMLKRRGWIRLVRVTITTPGTTRRRREVAGGWLLPLGRLALRDEITRRGGDMLARPASRPPHPVSPVSASHRRPVTPARAAGALPFRPRSVTANVDPFVLLTTGGSRYDDNIPF